MSHISNRGPDHWMFNSLWKWQAIGRLATRANYASLIRSGIGINEIQGHRDALWSTPPRE